MGKLKNLMQHCSLVCCRLLLRDIYAGRAMAAQPAFAQSGPLPATLGYVRQPCVSGRTVAFVAEEDLWLTDLDASMPRRLTHLRGASHPLLSPTANMLAFAFASDLWVMALADGQRRCHDATYQFNIRI